MLFYNKQIMTTIYPAKVQPINNKSERCVLDDIYGDCPLVPAVQVMTHKKYYEGKEPLFTSAKEDIVRPAYFRNGLVGGLMRAYNLHCEIVLRPEDFWCAIMAQFCAYVNANNEALRTKIVDFEGQKELTVEVNAGFRDAPYDEMTVSMGEQIKKNIKDPLVADWIIPNFTTTTTTDKVVFSAIMMASMQKYFKYTYMTMCGIPKVTLLGTQQDYEEIVRRLDKLLEFELFGKDTMNKWYGMLKQVMNQVCLTATDGSNSDFWNQVCHIRTESGKAYFNGWISVFCCFNDKGEWQGDNFTVGRSPYAAYFSKSVTDTPSTYPVVNISSIPSGTVSVPVLIKDYNTMTRYKASLISGSCMMKEETRGEYTELTPRLDFMLSRVDDGEKF